jgi:hypothetical protein
VSDTRTVHAGYNGMEIVRYDRAGKWYLEPMRRDLPRQRVTLSQAVDAALWGVANANGFFSPGWPGGNAFDREYMRRATA